MTPGYAVAVQPTEAIAAALGLANIVLVIRRSVWNFPVALAMVTLYGFVFLEAKLYSDTALQAFFFAINLYGWASWARNRAQSGEIEVRRLGPNARLAWIGGTIAATLVWGWLMHRLTDASLPWWDAGVAMGSIASQILLARRAIENWHGWIAVNLASVPLYIVKQLYLTAGLYAIFLVLAVAGLAEWRRAAHKPGL